jgi:hypothetical protein
MVLLLSTEIPDSSSESGKVWMTGADLKVTAAGGADLEALRLKMAAGVYYGVCSTPKLLRFGELIKFATTLQRQISGFE